MTTREVYEYLLIEQNKRKAPSMLLKDFNYFLNKAIQEYLNMRCRLYDEDQQHVDDLEAVKIVDYPITMSLQGLHYAGALPDNYFHILNCEVVFSAVSKFLCYEQGDTFTGSAQRLPTSSAKHVNKNYYFKPSLRTPYFYSNGSNLEIRSGDTTKAVPSTIYIDYLKEPDAVELTQDQIDEVDDNSQVLQFSKYVCDEIVKVLVKLVLENTSDVRLKTNIPVNQTIVDEQYTR